MKIPFTVRASELLGVVVLEACGSEGDGDGEGDVEESSPVTAGEGEGVGTLVMPMPPHSVPFLQEEPSHTQLHPPSFELAQMVSFQFSQIAPLELWSCSKRQTEAVSSLIMQAIALWLWSYFCSGPLQEL
eukprot:TRINITY_DN28050_c0_g1_i1.p1 TRINITY_DN28050_c0_g1~~TRINITY_DN28050_c0_g1_i1.p1  ORF type:complete len:130 (-),score=25.42 TRINITY_DN28050_c0_g1_i1:35-424(-)